jgi:hypothetical protein
MNLLELIDNKDPISLTDFWIEENGEKKIVFPLENINKLVFYYDHNKILRCFEKESLSYLKTINYYKHPITNDKIPKYVFKNIKQIKIIKTIDDLAFEIFQLLTKISIFIDYKLFMKLSKEQLIKFNYELKSFWNNNFTIEQRLEIYNNDNLFIYKDNLKNKNIIKIQEYILNDMKILLLCENIKYKYMLNYIIIGALTIVIPEIKKMYSDIHFDFI